MDSGLINVTYSILHALSEKTVILHESSISFLSVRFVRVVEISLDL